MDPSQPLHNIRDSDGTSPCVRDLRWANLAFFHRFFCLSSSSSAACSSLEAASALPCQIGFKISSKLNSNSEPAPTCCSTISGMVNCLATAEVTSVSQTVQLECAGPSCCWSPLSALRYKDKYVHIHILCMKYGYRYRHRYAQWYRHRYSKI